MTELFFLGFAYNLFSAFDNFFATVNLKKGSPTLLYYSDLKVIGT